MKKIIYIILILIISFSSAWYLRGKTEKENNIFSSDRWSVYEDSYITFKYPENDFSLLKDRDNEIITLLLLNDSERNPFNDEQGATFKIDFNVKKDEVCDDNFYTYLPKYKIPTQINEYLFNRSDLSDTDMDGEESTKFRRDFDLYVNNNCYSVIVNLDGKERYRSKDFAKFNYRKEKLYSLVNDILETLVIK